MTTTLLVPQLLASGGLYPTHDSGQQPANFTMAMIQSFGGAIDPYGAKRCQGQLVLTSSNPPLFSLLGTSYGGDGATDFAYPQLDNTSAVGGPPGKYYSKAALGVTFLISLGANGTSPVAATVMPFAGSFVPSGWLACNGAMLQIAQYTQLYALIGTAFGGDGHTTFALPNLSGAAPVGVGNGVTMGQKLSGGVAGLGLAYLICVQGEYPEPSGDGGFPPEAAFLGQITASASAQIPLGWAACNGALLSIAQYPRLYEVLGTSWGGDGQTSFALPDLRGKMIAGKPENQDAAQMQDAGQADPAHARRDSAPALGRQ